MAGLADPFWKRLLLALDQLACVLLSLIPICRAWGFGDPDETISSVVGKQYLWYHNRRWPIYYLYHFLEWLDPGHCARSIEHDEGEPFRPP